jgi:glycosyltransferase involved in cell wall biosynthesis
MSSRVPLTRIIGRLEVGGAATQAITMTRLLDAQFDTQLLTGPARPGEDEMTELMAEHHVQPTYVSGLRRAIRPHDAAATAAVARHIRRHRPAILHSHAAKGGTVGRVAAVLSGSARPPVIVHTFHGHVLRGYFNPALTRAFVQIERALARFSTRLIAVSPEVRDELLDLGVGNAGRFEVVPVGFDLSRFESPSATERAQLRRRVRAELDVPEEASVVCLIARLAPIKRVDRFLRIAAAVTDPTVHFVIVGSGHDMPRLQGLASELGVDSRVHWAGFRTDIPALVFASDVMALTSDNEGTPVSLIEAQAAGLPVVATRVGGTASVVRDGESGLLFAPDDESGFAAGLQRLSGDPALRIKMGRHGARHVSGRYSVRRLVADLSSLYGELLSAPRR